MSTSEGYILCTTSPREARAEGVLNYVRFVPTQVPINTTITVQYLFVLNRQRRVLDPTCVIMYHRVAPMSLHE